MRAARLLLWALGALAPVGLPALEVDPPGHRCLPPLPQLRFASSDPLRHRSPGSRQRRRRVRARRAGGAS